MGAHCDHTVPLSLRPNFSITLLFALTQSSNRVLT